MEAVLWVSDSKEVQIRSIWDQDRAIMKPRLKDTPRALKLAKLKEECMIMESLQAQARMILDTNQCMVGLKWEQVKEETWAEPKLQDLEPMTL